MITSSEIGMLIEFWNKMSNFIPAKDKSDAANSFVAMLDDYGIDDQSINELKENDEHLEEAFEEYYQESSDSNDEESWYNEDENEEW
jgi:hypothetical protein|tara:strand:+ start:216 stop:476 length:261 start_codon:yes stop_codon:yes gene_type:complete